jgi:hypothetical protein
MNIIKDNYGKQAITRTLPDQNDNYLEVTTFKYYDGIVRSSLIKYKRQSKTLSEFLSRKEIVHPDIKRLTEKKLKELHLKAVNHFDIHNLKINN